MDYEQWLILSFTEFQIYALFFLLGSFVVAALSDIKRMSAQVEFVEVWTLVVVGVMAYDIYNGWYGGDWFFAVVKWGMILFFSILSHKSVGIYFSLARGDVVACAAVAGLLAPLPVLAFYLVLKPLDFIMRPFLRVFGSREAYPFMPVIFVGTMGLVAFAAWVLPILTAQ